MTTEVASQQQQEQQELQDDQQYQEQTVQQAQPAYQPYQFEDSLSWLDNLKLKDKRRFTAEEINDMMRSKGERRRFFHMNYENVWVVCEVLQHQYGEVSLKNLSVYLTILCQTWNPANNYDAEIIAMSYLMYFEFVGRMRKSKSSKESAWKIVPPPTGSSKKGSAKQR